MNLTGSGTTPTFSYELVQNGQSTTIVPGQSIDIPPVVIASPTTFSVVVTNTGNAPVTITSAAIIGLGFRSPIHPTFPLTLAPGASAHHRNYADGRAGGEL